MEYSWQIVAWAGEKQRAFINLLLDTFVTVTKSLSKTLSEATPNLLPEEAIQVYLKPISKESTKMLQKIHKSCFLTVSKYTSPGKDFGDSAIARNKPKQ